MPLNDRTRKWLPWLLLAITLLVTAAVYWPGVSGGWIFDDFPNIVDNAAIHITPGHSTLAAWVNSALSSPSSFLHRPLASLTFSLNWYFGGADPWGFKVVNIFIHLLNGVLVFAMLRALLRLVALRGQGRAPAHAGDVLVGRSQPAGDRPCESAISTATETRDPGRAQVRSCDNPRVGDTGRAQVRSCDNPTVGAGLPATDLTRIYFDARAAVDAIKPGAYDKLPYTSRVLAENLVRRCDPASLTATKGLLS